MGRDTKYAQAAACVGTCREMPRWAGMFARTVSERQGKHDARQVSRLPMGLSARALIRRGAVRLIETGIIMLIIMTALGLGGLLCAMCGVG